MDIVAIISLIMAFAMILFAYHQEGGAFGALWQYTAALIVFGGTFGAVGLSFPLASIKKIPSALGRAFGNKKIDRLEIMNTFMALSTIARKDGLLALEHELEAREMDPFIVTGLRLVIDGADEEVVRQILETRIINLEHENEKAIAVFESAAGFSPTMGVLGTVMGLVSVLGELGGDVAALGEKIGVAFIATLYGVGFANLIYLPIATKLKELNSDEVMAKNMMLEGIQLLRGGSNPAFMKEQLKGYLEENEEEGQTEEGER
jgi:chemotaxis protein MotA